jgi:hypothetical protein
MAVDVEVDVVEGLEYVVVQIVGGVAAWVDVATLVVFEIGGGRVDAAFDFETGGGRVDSVDAAFDSETEGGRVGSGDAAFLNGVGHDGDVVAPSAVVAVAVVAGVEGLRSDAAVVSGGASLGRISR